MKLDALAIGTHPDDVELSCGGTVALLAEQGHEVGILHLTRGERGTRGTPEEREVEAGNAARALGAVEMAFLDCGDGALRHGEAEEDALIEVLRAWRPEILLGPPASDRVDAPSRSRTRRPPPLGGCLFVSLGINHPRVLDGGLRVSHVPGISRREVGRGACYGPRTASRAVFAADLQRALG